MGGAADRALERLIGGSPADDDAAILVAAVTEVPAEVRLELPADPHALAPLRARVGRWLELRGLQRHRQDVLLALSEACNNAIEHGYRDGDGVVRLVLAHEAGTLTITVADDGAWREPQQDTTRGRGLLIMKALMHDVGVTHDDDGTRVVLRRDLERPVPASPPPQPPAREQAEV